MWKTFYRPTIFVLLFASSMLLLIGSNAFAAIFFTNTGQSLGGNVSYDVALANLDSDNAIDVVIANGSTNCVRMNTGSGFFSTSCIQVGNDDSRGVAVGQLDNNSSIDLFFANANGDNQVWLNNGSGNFSLNSQTMNPAANSRDVVLGYLNNDNFLDGFVANNGANEVWINDGTAVFTVTQSLGSDNSLEVAIGDLNGDTKPDVYVTNGGAGTHYDELWLNNGAGSFSASGETLDIGWNEGVALGDLDGDTDLDIFLADWTGSDAVWINQGGDQGGTEGQFVDSAQSLSVSGSLDVALVDVDNDTDLDAIIAKWSPTANEVWLNDGNGNFSNSGEVLDTAATYEVGVADLDNDNDTDIFFGNFGGNTVWLRDGLGPLTANFNLDSRQNDAGYNTYPWMQAVDASLPVALNYGSETAVSVKAQIETSGGVTNDTISFLPQQTDSLLSVNNPLPPTQETVTLTLSIDSGAEQMQRSLVNPLSLVFINPDKGANNCVGALCDMDWLLKLLGFDTSFWMIHHLQLLELDNSTGWDHYHGLFNTHNDELIKVIATNPLVLWQTFDALETWTEPLYNYDQGMGGTISTEMANSASNTLTAIHDAAAADYPLLAARLQMELDILQPAAMAGQPISDAVTQIANRQNYETYLPIITKSN